MDLLVIGGTGFLSSAVVDVLAQAGHRLTLFTRGQRPAPDGVPCLSGDRRDVEAFVRRLEGLPFDAVVDCICYTPEDALADLRAFGGRVGHLVLISTDFVYGPDRTLPMSEETPRLALNGYGRAKAAAEDLFLSAWEQEGFPVTILRPPHILGAGGQLGSGSLQGRDPALLDRLERRVPIPLLDGGALLVQPVLHRDVGRACAAVLGREQCLGRVYNAAGPDWVTTRRYYDLIAGILGVEEPEYLSLPAEEYVRAFPDRAPFAQHRVYRTDRLEEDSGYRPATTLRDALIETVDWLQASGSAVAYRESEADRALAAVCRAFQEELGKILVC